MILKIYKKNNNTKKYKDDVNTFSYHIIKTINLNNINNFIKTLVIMYMYYLKI